MKLSKIIESVGDNNIVLQNILHSSPNINVGKNDGKISFYKDKAMTQDLVNQAAQGKGGKWTALVVWLPTDKIPK